MRRIPETDCQIHRQVAIHLTSFALDRGRFGSDPQAVDPGERPCQLLVSHIAISLSTFPPWSVSCSYGVERIIHALATSQGTRIGAPTTSRRPTSCWSGSAEVIHVPQGERNSGIVVIQPTRDWSCAECGDPGDLLRMQDAGPLCLGCSDLDHLVFLPARHQDTK